MRGSQGPDQMLDKGHVSVICEGSTVTTCTRDVWLVDGVTGHTAMPPGTSE